MVCNIKLVVLNLVVGTPIIVFALTILMVSASVFEASFVDRRCDGCCVTNGIIVAQSRVCVICTILLTLDDARCNAKWQGVLCGAWISRK